MLGLLILLSAASAAASPCEERAQSVLHEAEKRPMKARASFILLSLQMDPELGCGIVPIEHWSQPPKLPKNCDWATFDRCTVPEGIPVARQVQKDVHPELFLKVQSAAIILRESNKLKRPNRRLLQLLLLSDAVRRGG